MARVIVSLILTSLLLGACDRPEMVVSDMAKQELSQASASKNSKAAEMQDQFVVEFNTSAEALEAEVKKIGGTVKHIQPEIGIATITDITNEKSLQRIKGVKFATRDVQAQWIPSMENMNLRILDEKGSSSPPEPFDPATAPLLSCQWKLDQIDAQGAWNQGAFGEPDIKVAVLDSGIDPDHFELIGKIDLSSSRSMLTDSPCGPSDVDTINDLNAHGTFVANQITSNNFLIAAPATNTVIVSVKVLNCTGSGSFGDIIAGIYYAGSLPDVHVINASLGAYFPKSGNGRLIGALSKAINYAESQGKLFVAAAGNDSQDLQHNKNFVSAPAELGSGMSVYATDYFQNLASYSNHGVSGTDVGAPGGDVVDVGTPPLCPFLSGGVIGACSTKSLFFTCNPDDYLIGDGTSFASPIVAGIAALVDGEASGSLNGNQLHSILKRTADDLGKPGTDNIFSHGRVNAAKAVAEVTGEVL